MAKSQKNEQPKTRIKEKQTTQLKQPKTRIKEKQPTKVVERVTVIQKAAPEKAKLSPWVIIAAVAAVLLLVFLPIFPAQKTVDKTETIMVPVTKTKQEQITTDESIKTYTGYLEEKGQQQLRTGSRPEQRSVIRYINGVGYTYTYIENVPYSYYDTVPGRQTTIDAVAEIVEVQQARGPDNTWIVTLTAYDGTQTVYRDIVKQDLTKTGKTTVKVTKTVNTPYTEQEPQQVTKQQTIDLRVSLLSLMLKNY